MKNELLSNEELKLFNRRYFIIKTCLGIPFLAITWRLWDLQIKKGKQYSQLSLGNRIRLRPILSPRGLIFDRRGTILVKNIPSYNLVLIKADVSDMSSALKKILKYLKVSYQQLQQMLEENQVPSQFEPTLIFKHLTSRQIALINAYQEEFPGILIDVATRRYYPFSQNGGHVNGYIGRINEEQLKQLPKTKKKSGAIIGQGGIESIYNELLVGIDGGEQVEVDSTGRVIKSLKSIDPIPGHNIELTIDIRLQQKVELVIGNQNSATIVMNPNNGEILSMVSLPSFNPNEFSQGLSDKR
jgi:penicillin-binding protein 2